MRRGTIVASLTCLVGAVLGRSALAWWPLAHGLIAVRGGPVVSPGYHETPDIWPSVNWDWQNSGVADEFCWGHVCFRWYGTPGELGRNVVQPAYYDVGAQRSDNDPARHMRVLFEKLSPIRRTLSMDRLPLGFAAHNAEDQAGPGLYFVHFNLAPGALSVADGAKWSRHQEVEMAVEAVAYVEICYGGNRDAAFDAQGKPVGLPYAPPFDYRTIAGATTGDAASDGLLCLAMKAFRKKEQTVDRVVPAGLMPKDRIDITNSRQQEIKMSQADLLWFDVGQYLDARNTLYGNPDPAWPEAPRWREYFDQAVQDANGVQ